MVPVGNYNLDGFVGYCVDNLNNDIDLQSEVSTLKKLVEASVGKNPRAIKRIFNALLLSILVARNTDKGNEILQDKKNIDLLFAVLCLQQTSPTIYDYITQNQEYLETDFFGRVNDGTAQLLKEDYDIKIQEDELERVKGFIKELRSLIDSDNNGISDDELNAFQAVLSYSAVTGSGEGQTLDQTKKRRKTRVEYQENIYESGTRRNSSSGKYSLSRLARDILATVICEQNWDRDKTEEFRQKIFNAGTTTWLGEIIIFEDQILNLPRTSTAKEKYGNGHEKTNSLKVFAHNYVSDLTDHEYDPNLLYDVENAKNDKNAIVLPDGTRCYLGRYFFTEDIHKMLDFLNDDYGYQVDLSETTI